MIDHKYLLSKAQIKALSDEEIVKFYNAWANYWRYDIGINVMPAAWRLIDKEKKFVPIIPWKEYQNKPIPEKIHQEWIDNGSFVTGIAGIFGPVWHRPDKRGYYFGQIDVDNALAIKEIMQWKGDDDIASFAKRTVVEQHEDNKDRSMHIDIYSKWPLKNKDADVPKEDGNRPSFEVHCIGRMGIMASSKHRKGYPMMILSSDAATTEPMTLEDDHLEQYLNNICIKHGLRPYLENGDSRTKSNNSSSTNSNDNYTNQRYDDDDTPLEHEIIEMLRTKSLDAEIKIQNGTRHKTLLKIADSILFRYSDNEPLSSLKDFFMLVNEHYCKPPLSMGERDQIWDNAVDYVGKQKALESKRILTVSEAVRENPGPNKTVRGTIFSISAIFKVATKLCYRCLNCDILNNGRASRDRVNVYFNDYKNIPSKCSNCSEKKLELDDEKSIFNDAKIVTLQNIDLRTDLDETLEVMLLDEYTKDVKAGESVVIRGTIYYGQSNLGRQSKTRKTIALMSAKFVLHEGKQDLDITESDIKAFHRFAEMKHKPLEPKSIQWLKEFKEIDQAVDNKYLQYIQKDDILGQQQDARDVSERYIAKSNPWIVMVSTPNAPEGLFEKIEREPENTCLYKRLFLDYTYGMDKIYTREEIALAQKSPSFEREYNLKYLGKVGNVFHSLDIEAAIVNQQQSQEMLDWSTNVMIGRSMGIDVAWGDTSKFAIVITQYRNNKVEIFYAESFDKPQMNQIVNHILQLKQRHHITKLYVDGANPEVIRELKRRIGEYEDYHYYTEEQLWLMRWGDMQIIPVNFQKRHKEMLQWTYTLMSKRFIKIHPSLQKLIVSLRTAVVIDDWKLDKQQTSHDDILDSFRLALCNYEPPRNI